MMLNPVLPFKSSARHRLMILEKTFLLEVDLGWEEEGYFSVSSQTAEENGGIRDRRDR